MYGSGHRPESAEAPATCGAHLGLVCVSHGCLRPPGTGLGLPRTKGEVGAQGVGRGLSPPAGPALPGAGPGEQAVPGAAEGGGGAPALGGSR